MMGTAEAGNLTGKSLITVPKSVCGGEGLSVNADVTNRLLNSYGYDTAGNMTYDPTPGHQLTHTYDQENRITCAGGYAYTYDADGNRVKKSSGSTGTLYWYMTPGIVAESDLSGVTKSEYVFFNGERVARRDYPAGSVAYYFSDHLKTASVVTDSLGSIRNESDFYPWGGELQFVNADSNHYKFTGKERDTETGLDYFGARYYSNGLGRFITPDWSGTPVPVPYAHFIDPQSLNQYTYVRNLPTSNIDLDGHVQAALSELKPGECNSVGCRKTDEQIFQDQLNAFYKKHPWAKSWDEFVEKVDNTISGNGWKTDEQVTADEAVRDAKNRADWAKTYPTLPYPDIKIGIVLVGPGSLTRYGTGPETLEKLEQQAAKAEATGKFPHGVSTTTNPKPNLPGSTVPRSEVEKVFPVQQTGADPAHHTVILPKPITQTIVDAFNKLFWGGR